MSKHKYRVTQINKWKLEIPCFMTMSTKRKSQTNCRACRGGISVGETYFYDADLSCCYCVACIGVEGDPEALTSIEKPEFGNDDLQKEVEFVNYGSENEDG